MDEKKKKIPLAEKVLKNMYSFTKQRTLEPNLEAAEKFTRCTFQAKLTPCQGKHRIFSMVLECKIIKESCKKKRMVSRDDSGN